MDVAAVAAFPVYLVFAFEVLAILNHICQGFITQIVLLFHFGNLGEGFGNLIVTLLLGNFGSVFVQKREFLMLASSRRFKILPGGPNRCRIVSIHMDDYSTEISNDVVIKNLGMFTFVISSFCENCGDMQQAFFFGDLCVERIAVASLRLPCK